jgi:DNA-binding transcriptional LysR family regulator
MGTELVVRSGRHISLTSAELQAFADARGLLSRTDQLEQRARRAADGDRGYLSLGSNLDDFHSPLPRLLAGFQHTHSGVHIQSRLDHSQPLADDVTAGRLDNAFLTPPLLSHAVSLVEFELPPVRIIGVLPKGHPSVSKRELNLKRLRDENFVLPEPTCGRAFTFS